MLVYKKITGNNIIVEFDNYSKKSIKKLEKLEKLFQSKKL